MKFLLVLIFFTINQTFSFIGYLKTFNINVNGASFFLPENQSSIKALQNEDSTNFNNSTFDENSIEKNAQNHSATQNYFLNNNHSSTLNNFTNVKGQIDDKNNHLQNTSIHNDSIIHSSSTENNKIKDTIKTNSHHETATIFQNEKNNDNIDNKIIKFDSIDLAGDDHQDKPPHSDFPEEIKTIKSITDIKTKNINETEIIYHEPEYVKFKKNEQDPEVVHSTPNSGNFSDTFHSIDHSEKTKNKNIFRHNNMNDYKIQQENLMEISPTFPHDQWNNNTSFSADNSIDKNEVNPEYNVRSKDSVNESESDIFFLKPVKTSSVETKSSDNSMKTEIDPEISKVDSNTTDTSLKGRFMSTLQLFEKMELSPLLQSIGSGISSALIGNMNNNLQGPFPEASGIINRSPLVTPNNPNNMPGIDYPATYNTDSGGSEMGVGAIIVIVLMGFVVLVIMAFTLYKYVYQKNHKKRR